MQHGEGTKFKSRPWVVVVGLEPDGQASYGLACNEKEGLQHIQAATALDALHLAARTCSGFHLRGGYALNLETGETLSA